MSSNKDRANLAPEIMPKKTVLRHVLLTARCAISAELRHQWDAAIGNQVLDWWTAHPVPTLGVYWPIRGEPDLRPIYSELAARGAQLALPIVAGKELPLKFAAWLPGDPLVKGAMGVSVPARIDFVSPDALLIPCLGFNHGRIRLGYGGGYYDRTLAAPPRPLAIGIAYACALATFNADLHDIGLDRIITEETGIAAG